MYPILGAASVDDYKRWSSIPVSEELEVLNILLDECHSVRDLLKERHLLHTFTAEELKEFQKCQKCDGKFYLRPMST